MQEIAGYYINLLKGLEKNGLNVTYACVGGQRFDYAIDKLKKHKPVFDYYQSLQTKGTLNKVKRFVKRMNLFIWAIRNHDVFIFGFGSSLLFKNKDLRILKFLNKKVIINMIHGSELRPTYLSGTSLNTDGSFKSLKQLKDKNDFLFKRAKILEKHADSITAGPYNCQYLTKRFINHYELGLPFSGEVEFGSETKNDSFRILHAPSNPVVKGSNLIKKVVRGLISSGYNIDFIEIQNRPHHEVINEIRQCDLVIDQLYSDCQMAGLATEAAFFGKPSIVAGQNFEYLNQYVSETMLPPTYLCKPLELEHAILKLMGDNEMRAKLGEDAQKFVSNQWDFVVVAKKFIQIIDGDIPENWFVSPLKCAYLDGIGLSNENLESFLSTWNEQFGIDGFNLNHNKDLLNNLKEKLDQIQKSKLN